MLERPVLVYHPTYNRMVVRAKIKIKKGYMDRFPFKENVRPKKEVESLSVLGKYIVVVCSRCGVISEWDEGLGDKPLCLKCWDEDCAQFNVTAIVQRSWRERNKERLFAQRKEYRERNKEKIVAVAKAYRERNKERIAAWRKEFYELNKAEILRGMSIYYQSHRAEILERVCIYAQSHKAEAAAWMSSWRKRKKEKIATCVAVNDD